MRVADRAIPTPHPHLLPLPVLASPKKNGRCNHGLQISRLRLSPPRLQLQLGRTARSQNRPRLRRRQSRPHHRRVLPHRTLSARTRSHHGRAGLLRRKPRGLRLRRHVQRRVRPGDAGTGARRFRPPQLCQRAVRAGHVSHLHLRLSSPEEYLAPAVGQRRKARLLRPHRARRWFQSRSHDHHSPQGRRRVHPQRRKTLDYFRQSRRRGHHLGQGSRRRQHRPGILASRPIAPASPPTKSTANGACAHPSPAGFRCKMFMCPPPICCPAPPASNAR